MLRHAEVRDKINNRWHRFFKDRCLTLKTFPIIKSGDSVFTMGSCFASEIRYALERHDIPVGPNYAGIPLDKNSYSIDELPDHNHLNFYNSFTVLQEFERLADQWTQEKDDYWKISRNQFANKECYQDPYRRLTFGNSPDKLAEANAHINSAINEAAKQASVFFFTFGVTEIFRLKSNGRVVGQKPAYYGGGGVSETELYLSTFSENFENLEKLREIVKLINPTASMVVTVSPVPLERTFSGQDVVVANCEGKSTLRAVLGEFSRMYNDVIYFPAYEMVTTLGEIAYIPGDLRHVKKSVVDMIVQTFANAHVNTTNNRE